MFVDHPADAHNCFLVGDACLKRGDYALAERWFQRGVYSAGHDFANLNPVTEAVRFPTAVIECVDGTYFVGGQVDGGYLVRSPGAADNFKGLSCNCWAQALELAGRGGNTPEARQLVSLSERCQMKANQFDPGSYSPPGDFMEEFNARFPLEPERVVATV